MFSKLTTELFISKAKLKHGNKYDYSLVDYEGSKIPVTIICTLCNIRFIQTPNSHLMGNGCYVCGLNLTKRKLTKSFLEFKTAALIKHPHGRFEYFNDGYVNRTTPIDIRCIKHDIIFKQIPKSHLRGSGCFMCNLENNPSYKTKSHTQYILELKNIHGNQFDYSKVNYKTSHDYITIICNECHLEFKQLAYVHLNGAGCPNCKMPVGEKVIQLYLNNNKIQYIKQKTYINCRSPKNRMLKYDFYVPDYNLLIEFDGKQHFELSNIRGYKLTKHDLETTKLYDKIKTEYAYKNHIKLLRIPYWDMYNISNVLHDNLK